MIAIALAAALALAPTPAPSPSNAHDVTFVSKDGTTLAGTLSWPAGTDAPVPAFVLIGGSGMQDRDETIGPNKPLASIAAALNDAGFAVLRYDKRGVGGSSSHTPLAALTRQNYLDDVLAALGALKKDPHVDPDATYLLGHSEGGELAMGAVLQGAKVRGIVMLSPLPLPYATILREQLKRGHASAATTAQYEKLIATQPFLVSYAGVDPRIEIAQVGVPMLLLHGSKDFQVTDADLAGLLAAAHSAHRSLQYGELDGDNHLFAVLPPASASTGAEYMTAMPLDPRVAAAIIAWLAETR